ncbi:IQ domain-containing protein E [Chelonia mydas]|uniref:IQ domain-containing protein E n=1 Tax=Chelonia mydas TaxID=8469 RepID=M7BR52_CHEMY|nr:IQ domain-containing protein E [Chelonia mydas]
MSQPLKSDFDVTQARTNLSSSTPEYLKEALGMKKPKHARSSSNGYIPGTPDYKEKEDMYDEIIELKKTIQAQKSEADRMKTKIRRLEEENNRKDRQIEQLLDPSRGSDFAQTLAEKNNTKWVINGLKQKILKLEQQCKEKDNTINKFQTHVKTTNLEEMRIAMETYYEEHRSIPENRESQKQLKVLNAAVLRLSKNIKELQDENKSLKADLDQVLSSSPASSKTKNYNEWSRQRLVRRISELEKEVHEMENNRLQSSANDTSPLPALPPSASVQLDQPATQEPDPLEECERLRGLVKKLKGDRSALQNQLASKYSYFQDAVMNYAVFVFSKLNHYTQYAKDCGDREFQPSFACFQEDKEDDRKEQAAKLIQSQWKAYRNKKEEIALDQLFMTYLNFLLLSSNFRYMVSAKRCILLENGSKNASGIFEYKELQAAVVIQAAFRGHLARQTLLLSNTLGRKSPTVHSLGNKKSSKTPLGCNPKEVNACSLPGDTTFTIKNKNVKDDEDSEVTSEEVVEELTAEGRERRSRERKLSSLQPSSVMSSQNQLQPTLSPHSDEAHSDDSDDSVVSPSLLVKKNYSHF